MEHSEKYLQAKWVTENPKGYDKRDVACANSYCEAYLEGYNQALSIANVVEQSGQLVCPNCNGSDIETDNSDIPHWCKECGAEWEN